MDTKQLDRYASLLFDTGKRNSLINFKDTASTSVEIIAPDALSVFKLVERAATLEVFNSSVDSEEAEFEIIADKTKAPVLSGSDEEIYGSVKISKRDFAALYKGRMKKNQILIYNKSGRPTESLRTISKKGLSAIEESGVNLTYLAIGFIGWTESDRSHVIMRAPLLLVPVSIETPSPLLATKIKVIDDEIILNPAFMHKMHTERGIDLPEYDSDISIEEYFEKVREITECLSWTLEYECRIGLFSFQKINMYRDIKENGEKIMMSAAMRRMLGEAPDECDGSAETYKDKNSSETVSLHNVVDADSSQSAAIEMAKSGRSFVLQGPPGTGKSQTITNIIAELIGDGKRILFVSEKLAALNVVFEKLKRSGLEDFCLELHSHKANKKQVIGELSRTLKLQKSTVKDSAENELDTRLKNEELLNKYTVELHKTRDGINKSLYSLYEEFSRYRDAKALDFIIFNIKKKGADYLKRATLALERYSTYTKSIGYNYRLNCWYGFIPHSSSYELSIKTKNDLSLSISLIDELITINKKTGELISVEPKTVEESEAASRLLSLLARSEFITPSMLGTFKKQSILNNARRMKELAEKIKEFSLKFDLEYDKDVYNISARDFYKRLSVSFSGFFSRLFSAEYRKIMNTLRLSRRDGRKLSYEEAVKITKVLSHLQEHKEEFNILEKDCKGLLGEGYDGINTDFDLMIGDLTELLEIREVLREFGTLGKADTDLLEKNKPLYREAARQYSEAFKKASEAISSLCEGFNKAEYDLISAPLESLRTKLSLCLENMDTLENWCAFTELLRNLDELQLVGFIDLSIRESLPSEKITDSFLYTYYRQWIDTLILETPVISQNTRVLHDQAVKTFKEKDELSFNINKAKIKALVSERRPSLDMVAAGSEISILLRESEKKRNVKSIRRILGETTELVQKIKPCFLMSPLSVSTFLNSDFTFDTVIFDEASQIFPEDAIGAIYRAKQLIVVGDSKQMPPSNFFSAVSEDTGEEEIDEDIKDFESILDLSATSLPELSLKWHYRSKSEELIAFSNKNFYSDSLVTFPSLNRGKENTGVDFYYVNGTFDRTSKTNIKEAEAVRDLVFEHIRTSPEKSLGVIAFSISQQNLIEKLINRRRRIDQSCESYFTRCEGETFFVKNLETVQGDERDTIIFSIAYGRDSEGRLLMNFGPLNRAGGERRLNVAITRAKYNVKIVSSMRSTDIDLSRTQSVGARLLSEYLSYAENTSAALDSKVSEEKNKRFDSEFELEVYDFLRENGYSLDTQVGSSSFRIDIALKHPVTDNYLLAIECDGKAYHSARSARDRDRLRQQILESMGWKFYRIWSTDWYKNKRIEKDRLLSAVKNAIERADINTELKSISSPDLIEFENTELSAVTFPSLTDAEGEKSEPPSFETETQEVGFEFPKYTPIKVEYIQASCAYDPVQVIYEVMKKEAPISEEWILKRTSVLFGSSKVTPTVKERYEAITKRLKALGIVRKDGFLYFKGMEIQKLRVPSKNPDSVREIKHIAPEELALGLMEILKQNGTAERTSLYKILLKQFNVTRMTATTKAHLDRALELVKDKLIISGELVSIK